MLAAVKSRYLAQATPMRRRQARGQEWIGDAAQELGGAEGGAVGGEGDVAAQHHIQAAALAQAVDGGDDDLADRLELAEGQEVEAVRLAVDHAASLVLAAHLAADAEQIARRR